MRALVVGALLLLTAVAAGAHSASDAYLTLSAVSGGRSSPTTLHGQWDIALRDLDFVLHLDDDGDGHLTWSEVKRHQPEIERYAYAKLHFTGKDTSCHLKPGRQLIDDHADGAYAALFFDVICTSPVRLLSPQVRHVLLHRSVAPRNIRPAGRCERLHRGSRTRQFHH